MVHFTIVANAFIWCYRQFFSLPALVCFVASVPAPLTSSLIRLSSYLSSLLSLLSAVLMPLSVSSLFVPCFLHAFHLTSSSHAFFRFPFLSFFSHFSFSVIIAFPLPPLSHFALPSPTYCLSPASPLSLCPHSFPCFPPLSSPNHWGEWVDSICTWIKPRVKVCSAASSVTSVLPSSSSCSHSSPSSPPCLHLSGPLCHSESILILKGESNHKQDVVQSVNV